MKFYIVDDMHLEFSGYIMPGDPEGILLLAGDITTPCVYEERRTDQRALKLMPRFDAFFEDVSAKYKKVYYIAGNHEYYHGAWETTLDFMREATKNTNITVLDKEWVDLGDDTVLFGATLWTDFNKHNYQAMVEATYNMNDYRCIAHAGSVLMAETTYEDHQKTMAVLTADLPKYADKKVVIMTHHAPSLRSSHPRWGGTTNLLNWAYCTQLDQFVMDHPQIKYWVHGHTHESHDYMINNTRVLCNPRGYSYKNNVVEENMKFNDKLSFEV